MRLLTTREAVPLLLVAAIAAVLPLLGSDYYLGVGFALFGWIALAQSWTIVSGLAGYISLGHVVFAGIGGYVFVLTWGAVPVWAGAARRAGGRPVRPAGRPAGAAGARALFRDPDLRPCRVRQICRHQYRERARQVRPPDPRRAAAGNPLLGDGGACAGRNPGGGRDPPPAPRRRSGGDPRGRTGRGHDRRSDRALQAVRLRAVGPAAGLRRRPVRPAHRLFRAGTGVRSGDLLHHRHHGDRRRQRGCPRAGLRRPVPGRAVRTAVVEFPAGLHDRPRHLAGRFRPVRAQRRRRPVRTPLARAGRCRRAG